MEPTANAKFALVIAEGPKGESPIAQGRKWLEFLSNIQFRIQPNERTQRIHDNVWLIPLNTDMMILAQIFDWANAGEIRLRILFLQQEPDWIKYPPDAKNTD